MVYGSVSAYPFGILICIWNAKESILNTIHKTNYYSNIITMVYLHVLYLCCGKI